jgi:hypothetical protein
MGERRHGASVRKLRAEYHGATYHVLDRGDPSRALPLRRQVTLAGKGWRGGRGWSTGEATVKNPDISEKGAGGVRSGSDPSQAGSDPENRIRGGGMVGPRLLHFCRTAFRSGSSAGSLKSGPSCFERPANSQPARGFRRSPRSFFSTLHAFTACGATEI